MAKKLYVGNLPFSTSDQDLQDLFSEVGAVESVSLMRDAATGQARGFAFVEMASDQDAEAAVRKLNNYALGGRTLTVNEARPKASTGGSGGFRGGSSGYRGGNGGGGNRRRSEPRW